MEEMNYDEFKKKFMKPNNKWDFDLFKITCNKCKSTKVEFNGHIEIDHGYYDGEESLKGQIIIKCHACGNGILIVPNEYEIGLKMGNKT